ncbi:MAG: hypothetical protein QXG03_05250 [Halalkalicoccus sp.]
MRTLYALTGVAVAGVLALTVAIPEVGAPTPLLALYNLWLLATVALVVATAVVLFSDFVSLITSEHKR